MNSGTVPQDGRKEKWGHRYKNDPPYLPYVNNKGDDIAYNEYRINPPQGQDRSGTWRIVEGDDGSRYLTVNHYGKPFTDIVRGPPFLRIK